MKTRTKRLISAGLITVLVVAMLQFLPDTLPNMSHAEGEDESTYVDVVRGPIDNLWDLPQTKFDNWQELPRGTANRPFLVLEIVPYEEYAEFGYMISGCEPIDIENLEPTLQKEVFDTVSTMGTCDLMDFEGSVVYFEDESECAENVNTPGASFDATWAMPNGGVYGYYELVEQGQGAFQYISPTVSSGDFIGSVSTVTPGDQFEVIAPASIEYVGSGNGNLAWHTINEFNFKHDSYYPVEEHFTMAEYKNLFQDVVFEEDSAKAIRESDLRNTGDRIYTKRVIEVVNGQPKARALIIPQTKYNEYFNRELFLKYSVMPDDVDNYSIVIKTITPAELNENTEWIDYADLISISRSLHAGGQNYVDFWSKYNRLGKEPTNKSGRYTQETSNFEYERDLTFDCVLKIFDKVNADVNFAAIVLDDTIYNTVSGPTKNVTVDVYNWNLEKNKTHPTFGGFTGSSNNVYKLCSMLMCMDPYFFKQIYLSGDEPLVYDDNGVGKIRLQEGDAAEYWCFESFLLAPDDVDLSKYGNTLETYWNEAMWENYNYATCQITKTKKNWCNGHVYAYPGDSSLSMNFITQVIGQYDDYLKRFDEFAEYLDGETPHTAEAIAFILGNRKNPNDRNYGYDMKLTVLDLEPSVDLYEDGTPKYYLKPSYFTMLLPHFRGELEIENQTTAEFIGQIEDLNTKYDLIYIGLDFSGYNTKVTADGTVITDWNDDSLDGMIYFHDGDIMESTEHNEWGQIMSAKWLLDKAAYQMYGAVRMVNSTQMRFAGNDISRLKMYDLMDYLEADYPIVLSQRLYDLDTKIIKDNTYLYQLISEQKALKARNRDFVPIYGTEDTDNLEEAVKNALGDDITFVETPVRYDGTTASPTSAQIVNPHYLPRNSSGNAYLYFKINAAKPGYRFRVYVDLNRDSRFTDDEIRNNTEGNNNVLSIGNNDYTDLLPADWLGMLQWKVEVYLEANPSVRYEMTGCSAVQRNSLNSASQKKKINVLQIMPSDPETWDYQGALDLEHSGLFKKYYQDLVDYEISITSIIYDEYTEYFYYRDDRNQPVSYGFAYDPTKEIDDETNPVNLDKLYRPDSIDLMDYNMIIIGFGDNYAGTNMLNQYGQMDFLRYFANQGKSILFTHDLTTFFNANTGNTNFFANTQLRDIMGMNRYASVNYLLDANARERLMTEQSENAEKYDFMDEPEIHGYTYGSMKRMGQTPFYDYGSGRFQADVNINKYKGYKMPYRYLVKNLRGNEIGTVDQERGTGFNGQNDTTTIATKVNEGQITVYPYAIGDSLEIAPTHAQYYQLSPEDENLTVWYCLGGDNISLHETYWGTSLTYAVSPNDTMNNYYIYSKGNIFYSGVGHSTVTGDMEAKLFVNTIIAAYSAGYEPPKVEVTNEDATLIGSLKYDIELIQMYDFDDSGELVGVGESFSGDDYIVTFVPQDYNLAANTKLTCTIQWENGEYVTEVKRVSDGATLRATRQPDGSYAFLDFVRGSEYSLAYPKEYFTNYPWTRTKEDGTTVSGNTIRTVSFTIKNNRVRSSNTTILNMSVQPLFPLD